MSEPGVIGPDISVRLLTVYLWAGKIIQKILDKVMLNVLYLTDRSIKKTMSPRSQKQFKEIREEKKALIMETALELFATEGYFPTSISRIADKAGISKGLLYNYFESKEELIREIIFSGFDNLDRLFDPNKDGVLTKDELRFFIERLFALMQEERHFWHLYFGLFLQPPVMKLVEGRLNEILITYLSILSGYFEGQGYDDPETEALLFGALLDGISFNFILNADNFPVEKVKKKLIANYCGKAVSGDPPGPDK